jgi:hypothetical protein
MKKNYREIEFTAGQNIESAIKELKEHKDLVCGYFNGKMLYSDIDDMDSAFKNVTGKTKAEFDEAKRKRHEYYEAENKRHEEAIPELTKEWIAKGKAVLDEKYLELWNKIVPIRLRDLYKGFELGASLDIIKELNSGCEIKKAKGIIEEQGHSGMSFVLVCSIIKELCDRGAEFVSYVRT